MTDTETESSTPPASRGRRWRPVLIGLGVFVALFLLIQLVPYRVSNPSTRNEPSWDSPQTRKLAVVACFDCHSNESKPYTWEKVAPLSWWITNHVDEGRAALNFSECTKGGGGENDASETVLRGSMPPSYYTWLGLHSDAKLTTQEKRALADGLNATLRGWNCGSGGEGGGG